MGIEPKPRWRWTRAIEGQLKLAAELSSLVLLIGFVVSAALSGIIFNSWGLSFTQLATPTDVLMSGLQFASILLFPAIMILVARAASRAIRIPGEAPIVRSIIFDAAVQLVVMLVIRSISVGASGPDPVGVHGYTAGAGLALCALFWLDRGEESGADALWRRRWNRVALAIAAILVAVGLTGTVTQRVDRGYGYRDDLVVAKDEGLCGSGPARVLWMGSDNIVLRCGKGPRSAVLVLRSPDSFAVRLDRSTRYRCDPFDLLVRCVEVPPRVAKPARPV